MLRIHIIDSTRSYFKCRIIHYKKALHLKVQARPSSDQAMNFKKVHPQRPQDHHHFLVVVVRLGRRLSLGVGGVIQRFGCVAKSFTVAVSGALIGTDIGVLPSGFVL